MMSRSERESVLQLVIDKMESASHMVLNAEEEGIDYWRTEYEYWSHIAAKLSQPVEGESLCDCIECN